jgi:hypothetical protein
LPDGCSREGCGEDEVRLMVKPDQLTIRRERGL